jgi:hypothetical protein
MQKGTSLSVIRCSRCIVLLCSHVLVYRLGGSTYECSIIQTIGGCFRTVASRNGFENSGDALTDLVVDLIADEFQKWVHTRETQQVVRVVVCVGRTRVILGWSLELC